MNAQAEAVQQADTQADLECKGAGIVETHRSRYIFRATLQIGNGNGSFQIGNHSEINAQAYLSEHFHGTQKGMGNIHTCHERNIEVLRTCYVEQIIRHLGRLFYQILHVGLQIIIHRIGSNHKPYGRQYRNRYSVLEFQSEVETLCGTAVSGISFHESISRFTETTYRHRASEMQR